MKKLISILLTLTFCVSLTTPVLAAEQNLPFEAGKEGTFFAPTFGGVFEGHPSIVDRYYVTKSALDAEGPVALGKKAAAAMKSYPEGRKCIQMEPHIANMMMGGTIAGGLLLNPTRVSSLKKTMETFWDTFAAEGGQVEIVYDDCESFPNVYNFENAAIAHFREGDENIVTSYQTKGHLYEEYIKNDLIAIEKTPEYKEQLKPILEELNYPFSENYDLEYINIHPGAISPRNARFYESNPPEGADRAVAIMTRAIGILAEQQYHDVMVAPIQKHFPDVKFSNWKKAGYTGEINIYDHNGNIDPMIGDTPMEQMSGTHANAVFYGITDEGSSNIEHRPPSEWRYETYDANAFNELSVDYRRAADFAIANKKLNNQLQIWISNKSYSYNASDYYQEALFHGGMLNSDPFLFWMSTTVNGELDDEITLIDECFEQLDTLVGFEDRKSLIDDTKYIQLIDDRYILSGMYAGGKNVWRITPDLYTPGASMGNFLIKDNPPTFRIGNQNVEFPKGSYIWYPEEDVSRYGYWVISPEGTRPREWRDDKHPMPGPPTPADAEGNPVGYEFEPTNVMPDELDLSRSKEYKAPTPDVKPDEGNEGTEVAPPVQDIVTQTLNLNPMRGGDEATPLFLGTLPLDSQNHWARHTLSHMLALGIMQGSNVGMEPDKFITRAEFLAMLERILGAEEIAFTGEITDVKAEDWYATIMQTAATGGWINLDFVTGKANPDANITRAEMCSIMVKALSLTNNAENASFTDMGSMTAKVKADVSTVASKGLILGYEDGSFQPNGVLTRAETACLFERLIKQIPNLFPEE